MPESFYAADETRAHRVNDLFATIAPRYDLINDLQSFGLHRAWKRRLIQLAEVFRHGYRLLPRDVTLLAPVQQANNPLTVEVANVADQATVADNRPVISSTTG